MPVYEAKNYSIYKHRRQQLRSRILEKYPDATGAILLLGSFEAERVRFRQHSTFYYFTGIEEPGAALLIELKGKEILYLPDYATSRSQWVATLPELEHKKAEFFGFDAIEFLGKPCHGFSCFTYLGEENYAHLLRKLAQVIADGGAIFTGNPPQIHGAYHEQQRLVHYLLHECMSHTHEDMAEVIVDIAPLIASMRRTKDHQELELLLQAVDITIGAHEMAAALITSGVMEYQVQAGIEYIFTKNGGSVAFPSIVASGAQATVLHYLKNDQPLKAGELVVVDIGAEYNYYCADLTRTYSVGGKFTKRQRELYQMVLDVQQEVAELAKPGMWLNNAEHPEQSLQHLALAAFDKYGDYRRYMVHGIGHSLGMDVHDVSDPLEPLREGDVFTIEPGLYLAQEGIGIRIEDDYWMGPDGALCLSDDLPREPEDVEALMR